MQGRRMNGAAKSLVRITAPLERQSPVHQGGAYARWQIFFASGERFANARR